MKGVGMCLRPFLIVCWFCQTMSLCPTDCWCGHDPRGRHQVICAKGGMDGAIPVNEMDLQTEVVKITAPTDYENSLTIGPIFHEFQRLVELQITYSNVPAIGKHSFWGVPSLKHLNLTNNNISQVLEYNFRGLANLLELHLDYNRIESMGSGTFHHLPELRTLTLAHNRLNHLSPRLFLMLGKLRTLDLSFNELEHLDPEVFKDVQDLRTFSCRGCSLRKMNPHLYSLLSSLTHLDIGQNEFKYLDSHEFRDLRKLQVLQMDGNHFPVILEQTFSSQSRLKVLNLAHNRIAKVTTHGFDNLTSLVELDLSYNKLDRLEPTSVMPFTETLRKISINSNNIDINDFKYVLQIVNKIKELSIAELGYATLDLPLGLLMQLDSLKFLNMSGNELVHLPVQFLSTVNKLVEIDFSHNKFHGLDERLVVRLEKVKVHLGNNPWACDLCHITPMLSRINESVWVKDAVCFLPQNLKGRKFEMLTVGVLGWCGTGLGYREEGFAGLALTHNAQLGIIAAGAAVVLLVITMAAVVAGLLYNRHHAAFYYTNEEKRLAEREKIFADPVKKVSIATIDEITKDPELQVLAS